MLNKDKFKEELRHLTKFFYIIPCVLDKLHISACLCTPSGSVCSIYDIFRPAQKSRSKMNFRFATALLCSFYAFPPPELNLFIALSGPFFIISGTALAAASTVFDITLISLSVNFAKTQSARS